MIDTQQYKKKLEDERVRLIDELKEVGRKNPDDPTDWEATEGNVDPETADPVDVADTIEELGTNIAIEYPLGHQRRRKEGIPLLIRKFEKNVARVYAQIQQDRIREICLDRQRLGSMPVNELFDLLALPAMPV